MDSLYVAIKRFGGASKEEVSSGAIAAGSAGAPSTNGPGQGEEKQAFAAAGRARPTYLVYQKLFAMNIINDGTQILMTKIQ